MTIRSAMRSSLAAPWASSSWSPRSDGPGLYKRKRAGTALGPQWQSLARERYFAPRLRLIDTAEISLPGDWIEIDCWLLCVLTASNAENTGLLARRLI